MGQISRMNQMIILLTDVGLGDYIRGRRLTKAAQTNENKVKAIQ